MKRRHRRDRFSGVSTPNIIERLSDVSFRSSLARTPIISSRRVDKPRARKVAQTVRERSLLLRRVARPPVRLRLRNPALSVSRAYVDRTPHRDRREVVSCVKENLKEFQQRSGSGGSRRRVPRDVSRRGLFQAARKAC